MEQMYLKIAPLSLVSSKMLAEYIKVVPLQIYWALKLYIVDLIF